MNLREDLLVIRVVLKYSFTQHPQVVILHGCIAQLQFGPRGGKETLLDNSTVGDLGDQRVAKLTRPAEVKIRLGEA